MKKTIVTTAFIVLLTLMLTACSYGGVNISVNSQAVNGSGKVTSEARTVSGFSKVELESIGNLTIKQGDSESLTIKADDNILPYITSAVEGDTLVIGMKPNINAMPTSPIEYTLTVKSLSSVVLSGFGNISADELSGDDMQIKVSGSGNINVGKISAKTLAMHLTGFGNITVNEAKVTSPDLNLTGSGDLTVNSLEAETLNVTISGFGTATVSGKATDQMIRLTGSGNYQGGDVESSSANVTISGLGNATVWANDSLNLSITGSGNVKYYGDPHLTQTITGLGNVSPLGAH